MASRSKASKKAKIGNYSFFLFLGVFGIISILTGFYLNYRKSILSFSGKIPHATPISVNEYFDPVKINFKSIGLTLPIRNAKITNGIWEISENSASYLATSAKPGERGNTVIYGHNKKNVFEPIIGNVKKGNLIELITEENKIYTYEVKEVFEVTPEKVEVVNPADFEVLTVYTCTGFLDSKRQVIKAYPLNH